MGKSRRADRDDLKGLRGVGNKAHRMRIKRAVKEAAFSEDYDLVLPDYREGRDKKVKGEGYED